jgi:formate hydrogenlyase subunit 3/multisubunit Na+/H+ antiporter MnhD subunit
METRITLLILLPLIAGLVMLTVSGRGTTVKGILSLAVSLVAGWIAIGLYRTAPSMPAIFSGSFTETGVGALFADINVSGFFRIDALSQLIILLVSLFGVLVSVYTLKGSGQRQFHGWFLVTLGMSYGAALADNLILFVIFWGILAIALYMLIPARDERSSAAAKKTLIIIGSSDGLIILGLAIFYQLSGSFGMSATAVETGSVLSYTAFLALLAGSFAKAGAFPLHSWIPDYTGNAPAASSAYLPASLDKLLGIYFLVRICYDLFVMDGVLQFLIMLAGIVTIIAGVMMALVQHEYKKLLGFHAVSQVGYMVLGIGLGSAIGIAAGLFHMLNNALYKGGLFLVAGNLKEATGQDDLDNLGGLSTKMPVTFIAALVFALSISGVPPFNGFASKWMIYQGIIESGTGATLVSRMWILWLAVAVLGSALTLASFLKFISGAFLSRLPEKLAGTKERGLTMLLPVTILALLCVLTGVFATAWVVPRLFFPVTGPFEFYGVWQSVAVSVLIVFALLGGLAIYLSTLPGRFRRAESFIGGEKISDITGYPATGFFETIRNAPLLSGIYNRAYMGWFDLYHLFRGMVLWTNGGFSRHHDGVLNTYLMWAVGGLVIILIIIL